MPSIPAYERVDDMAMKGHDEALLRLEGLETEYRTHVDVTRAVRGVTLEIQAGHTMGIVGESGCGKSTIGNSILRTLPENGHIVAGECWVEGVDFFSLSRREFRRYAWDRVSMIFQGAMNALNPVFRVDDLLIEILLNHRRISRRAARDRVAGLFDLVGISHDRLQSYPHELSGGMRQRVVIAMSLLCDPKVIIADEPTTAFDVVVQDQILASIEAIQLQLGLGVLLITHDIAVVSETCDSVAVMYAGQIVEQGRTADVLHNPSHPYTIAMLNSVPNLYGERRELVSLHGAPPNLAQAQPGCAFAPRCPISTDRCLTETPPLEPIPGVVGEEARTHLARCHYSGTEIARSAWQPVARIDP